MSRPEEIRLEIPGYRLAGRVWGPADGTPVLALHGWLDNAATFDTLAPLLPGLRIVALDLPGHGHSSHAPPGMLYPFVDFVVAAAHALDALDWETCVMLGHSLGASVCATVAGTFPDRVRKLVMLEGLGPLSSEPQGAPARLAASVREQARQAARPPTVYESRARVASALARTPSKLEPGSVEVLLSRAIEETARGVRWRTDRRLRCSSRVRLTEPAVLAFLARIACPSLLVKAREGFTAPGEVEAARIGAVADLHLVEVNGRHHVHLDAPAQVAPHVASFLAAP